MAKTAIIHARTEPGIKARAESILKTLGLTTTEAINLFLRQVIVNKGLPFEVKIPNEETRKVLDDARKGIDIHRVQTVEELFKELEED